ncbi:MAG: hypothetical protein HY064_00815 [Bacteroidetes bacterium]|nr:hypothetical protein [Bacteroidota bacterium]
MNKIKFIVFFLLTLVFAKVSGAEKDSCTIKMNVLKTDSGYIISAWVHKKEKEIPLKDISVVFEVKRLFGWMELPEETTDSTGRAQVFIPMDLPPQPDHGLMTIKVVIEDNDDVNDASGQIEFKTIRQPDLKTQKTSRAIWASKAPVWLIIVVSVLLGGVWLTYAFVLKTMRSIKKINKSNT